MDAILKLLAAVTSGVFAGAAFYVSAVEHPARIVMGLSAALQEFRSSYKRAAPMQASLAFVCFLACAALRLRTHREVWLIAGTLVVAVIPFTLAFMKPVNRTLLDANSSPEDTATLSLLTKWARLHLVRAFLGLAGFVVTPIQIILG